MTSELGDAQSIAIDKPASEVFSFMADPHKLDLWSFGTWKTSIGETGVIVGRSIFDGEQIFLRIDPCQDKLLIDYLIGGKSDSLKPRIFARVTPGTVAGSMPSSSILTLFALRSVAMTDARWQRLTASHGFELQLIKSVLETGFDHRQLQAKDGE